MGLAILLYIRFPVKIVKKVKTRIINIFFLVAKVSKIDLKLI